MHDKAENLMPPKQLSKREKDIVLIKRGLWAYFLLLIFEGALRKWFLPGLATPLLVVRDPLSMFIIFKCIQNKVFKPTFLLPLFVFIGIISIFTALFFGHQNFIVALFGVRPLFLHVPLIFVFGQVWDNTDTIKLGKVLLWLSIMMTIIITLQFFSPQSAWINMGVGGDESGAGFTGAMGYMRPPGTFSFTNGVSTFYFLASPFIFFFLFNPKIKVNRTLLYIALIAIILAIPFSISRSVLFGVVLVLVFSLFIAIRNPKLLLSIFGGLLVMIMLFTVVSQQQDVQLALEVFTARFDGANEVEGGLEGVFIDRFLGGMYNALFSDKEVPFFGGGIGMGSNVGATLLSGSSRFLLPEGEWGRIIGELGVLLGISVVIARIFMFIEIFTKSFKLLKYQNSFSWLLMSTGTVIIVQGQWGQPTNLGFFVMFAGLAMASIAKRNVKMPND